MSYYTPGKIRALLRSYHTHLSKGKVPNLVMTDSGWEIVEFRPVEAGKSSVRSENDGLEAVRIMADLEDACKANKEHPLTTTECRVVQCCGYRDMEVREAAHELHLSWTDTARGYLQATRKMAKNLGWMEPKAPTHQEIINQRWGSPELQPRS